MMRPRVTASRAAGSAPAAALVALFVVCAVAAAPSPSAAQEEGGGVADQILEHLADGRRAVEDMRYADALTAFDAVLDLDDDHRQGVLGRALSLHRLGRARDAIEIYDGLVSADAADGVALFYRGLAYYYLGDFDRSRADFEAALQRRNASLIHARLGDALYASGDPRGALAAYRAAMTAPGAKPPWILRAIGNAHFALGRFEDAVAAYSEALRGDPQDGWAALHRGWARERLGLPLAALQDYDLAIEMLGGSAPEPAVSRGDLLRANGEPAAAYADYLLALDVDPDHPPALYGAARALLDQGQIADAEGHLDRLVALVEDDRPQLAAALFQRARARIMGGDHRRAETDLSRTLTLRPRFAEAHFNRGVARLRLDDVAGALGDFREATRLRPGDASFHYGLAGAAIAAGFPDEAEAAFRAAEALAPDAPAARLFRASILIGLNMPGAAIGVIDAEIADAPHRRAVGPALGLQGVALVRIGRFDEALDVAAEMIASQPRNPTGFLIRADALIALGQADAARGALEQANQLGADPATVARLAGRVWLLEARRGGAITDAEALARAEQAFDAAVLFSAESPEALALRAVTLERLGDYEGARADLDRAIAERPQDPELRFMRAGVLKELDRCDEAIVDYDAGLSLRPDNARAMAARSDCRFEEGQLLGGVADWIASWF